MLRVVALNAFFFLLPFAIYAGWLALSRGSATEPGNWPMRTIGYLSLAGVFLAVAALVTFIHFSNAPPDAAYRPATIGEDGRIVPGRLE